MALASQLSPDLYSLDLYPVGNLVHPSDPFRPQVKIISNANGQLLEEPQIANTWERDGSGEHLRAVVDALDPEALDSDPLKLM
jgi:hypothetical protein